MKPRSSLVSASRWPVLAAPCLIALTLLASPAPARAATPSTDVSAAGSSAVFAAWYSTFLSGMGSRTRVVQICVVTMCLALFILMKKFAPDDVKSAKRQASDDH
jgi:hypothetical protein